MWNFTQRVFALFMTPLLLLSMLAGLLVRCGSLGPTFIGLPRIGKDQVVFHMYKLRTMKVNAQEALARQLAESETDRREWEKYGRLANDPRIAGFVAGLARRFSVDELPQLINVVCGQMNRVGPRPLPADVILGMRVEDRMVRQQVFPGLTGLWQISGRSDLSISSMGRLDRFSVRKRSVKFDLYILLRTFAAVFSAKGAY